MALPSSATSCRSEYRKRRREVEDADGRHVDSLEPAPPAAQPAGIRGIPRALAKLLPQPREALVLVGASALLRGGRRCLRLRGRDDQEPGTSCAQTARRAALHRPRRHVRSGPHDACYSDRRRAWLSPPRALADVHFFQDGDLGHYRCCGTVNAPGSAISFAQWNRDNPPASPFLVRGTGSPCEKEKGGLCEEEIKVWFNPKIFLAKVGEEKQFPKPEGSNCFTNRRACGRGFLHPARQGQAHCRSQQGKEAVVAILGPGHFFGEGCLNGHPVRIATTRAVDDDCVTTRLEKATMIATIHNESGIF